MNFVLLQANEIDASGRAVLTGRRAQHIHEVLQVDQGSAIRIGVLDGALRTATVEGCTAEQVLLQLGDQLAQQPLPTADTLLLATPRPKVLLRMLSHAAAMGFARIILFRSWRVDKTWMQSRAFDSDVQRTQLLLGLEQAGRTQLPEVLRFDRFKPMVEDELPTLQLPQPRFVAHPYASTPTHQLGGLTHLADPASGPRAFTLAIGPDGGFLPYEVDKLAAAGFHAIRCGPHALRTETALAAIWAQLDLLRQQR
jgi:16S rRNA (uracil1498-N3)-methyltransferase